MARAPQIAEIEAPPEADRLEGFPHPRATERLYGHDEAERALAEAVRSGRMHHGWLITGPQGIGKATLAYRLATFLLAAPHERDALGDSLAIPPSAAAARQVKALSHPSLLVLRRPYDHKTKKLKTEIPVDEVRRLKSFLSMTSDNGQWRVVITDSADELNVNAANALLKSLEEPPPQTVFILIAASPGGLLPTIRSRCRSLALAPLRSEDLKRAVTQAVAASDDEVGESAAPEPGEWEVLERLAGGSVRRVLALKAAGGAALHKEIERLVTGLPRLDWPAIHKLSDELASPAAEQRYELFFELMEGLLVRLVRARALGDEGGESALARRLVSDPKLASWAELWETAAREKALTDALNLDRKALIMDMFSRLEALTLE